MPAAKDNPRIEKLVKILPRISSDLIEFEVELADTKWFDNQMDDPVTSTEKFAQEYIDVFKHYHAKYKDQLESDLKKPIRSTELTKLTDTDLTSLWKARQSSDRLGLPYDTYLNAAFRILCDRQYKQLPRPNQLYSSAVLEGIQTLLGGNTVASALAVEDQRFMAEHYCDSPAQVRLRDAVLERLKGPTENRSAREINISIAVYERQLLPLSIAQTEFDPNILTEAKSIAEPARVSDRTFTDSDFDNACLGIPHIKPDAEECSECSLKERCLQTRAIVEKGIKQEFGSLDQKGDKKREQARVRKQRQRERERLAALNQVPEHTESNIQ